MKNFVYYITLGECVICYKQKIDVIARKCSFLNHETQRSLLSMWNHKKRFMKFFHHFN